MSNTLNQNAVASPADLFTIWSEVNSEWRTIPLSLVQSYLSADLATDFAATAGIEVSRVQSIASLKTLLKSKLTNGRSYRVDGYIAGYALGGGLFTWDAASVVTADNVMVFTANQGGTGRWIRKDIGYLTPWDGGAVSGAMGNQSSVFTAIMAVINAVGSTINAFDMTGVWRLSTGILNITRDNVVLTASGFCQITRMNNGKMIQINADKCRVENISCRDNADLVIAVPPAKQNWDNQNRDDFFVISGKHNSIQFCSTLGGQGKAFKCESTSEHARLLFNTARYPGSTGLGLGGAYAPLCLGNFVNDSKPEGMQGDELNWAQIIGNTILRCGGVGNFAGNDILGGLFGFNFSDGGNSGFKIGQKGFAGSKNLAFVGNMAINAEKYGIALRNYYRNATPIAISKSVPAVATFARINITDITKANPCIITAPDHGLETDDKRRINNVVGMTELNDQIYRIRRLNSNTIGLLGLEDDIPLNTSSFGTYVSGGKLDHAFETERGQVVFSGVTGMTEINGLVLRPLSVTNTTVTFELDNPEGDDTDLNTIGFGTFIAGGLAEAGEGTSKSVVVGNVTNNNGLGSLTIGGRDTFQGPSNNVIMANSIGENISFFGSQPSSQVINRQIWFNAILASDAPNVTGDGTFYNVLLNQIDDTTDSYSVPTGKFTVPSSGIYEFQAGAYMGGCSGATAASLIIRAEDPWGNVIQNITTAMVPDGALPSAPEWSGMARLSIRLEKEDVVSLRVRVAGLGLVADLKAGSFFSGYARG